jgi:transcriptional regulator with XRE-family HTH domain
MMNTLSKLLINYREHKRLTQQELVSELSQYSKDFKNINTVTISRWETGTTAPSISKKQKLLHFFAQTDCFYSDTDCYYTMLSAYAELYEPLSTVFTKNYQYLIGNFPELELNNSHIHPLMTFSERKAHMEHIVDIETATNAPGYYTITPIQLEALCRHPSTFAIICERKRQHLGHFVMFKIKNSVAESVVRHKRNKYTLGVQDFCGPNEKGTFYVHALYGKNPKIAALLNVHAYIHLFKNMKTVDNVMIFSSRKDGILLTKDYGIELIAQGRDEKYGFDWHGLMSPVEDILFSDTVVKLVF